MSNCSGHTSQDDEQRQSAEQRLAARIIEISGKQPTPQDAELLLEAAKMILENEKLLDVASHPECLPGLGLGGTLAWHRDKINKLHTAVGTCSP